MHGCQLSTALTTNVCLCDWDQLQVAQTIKIPNLNFIANFFYWGNILDSKSLPKSADVDVSPTKNATNCRSRRPLTYLTYRWWCGRSTLEYARFAETGFWVRVKKVLQQKVTRLNIHLTFKLPFLTYHISCLVQLDGVFIDLSDSWNCCLQLWVHPLHKWIPS